ncbi:H-NS family nucleoid-associated regulatory protein [Delftia tsuruhatensis]|uniref:H-NS family nucleoid-associated regulatory protein n=1 Tax=Delftia tsuruhatensis TaxID=180282 RepID=UPI0039BC5980
MVQQHDLNHRDLFGSAWPKNSKHLCRNQKTGCTWSGRGRVPRWIEGRDRKPFEV